MKGILVAPTEPATIKAMGRVSSVPEKWGVDILAPSLRWGAQRKEFSDFIASLTGDRLAKEVMQMKRLIHRVLIIEGRPAWNSDGIWLNGFQRFTLKQYWGVLASIQSRGIIVQHSRDVRETVQVVEEMISWSQKDSHESLSTRPKHLVSKWGTKDDVDWAAWVLQSFEGVGAKTARAIVKQFDGAPLAWTVGEEELKTVPGVGKVMAKRLMRALGDVKGSGQVGEALAVIQHEADFYVKMAKSQAWRNHAQVILDAVKVIRASGKRNGKVEG